MKRFLTLPLLLFYSVISFSQDVCGDIGFESGGMGQWTCKSGTYGSRTAPCTSDMRSTFQLTAGACIATRHTVTNTGMGNDPNTTGGNGPSIPRVAPANLFPSKQNRFSFCLGDYVAGGTGGLNSLAKAESISYTFLVTKDNAGLTYMYSVFLHESNPAHKSDEAPRFLVKITKGNSGTGEKIDCGEYNVDASTDGTQNSKVKFYDGKITYQQNSTKPEPWKYTDWTKVALDLTSYIGQWVTIEFSTADCFPDTGRLSCSRVTGSHSAYAYVDLYCAPVEIISPDICANQPSVQICGPDGYATYEWDPSSPGIQPPFNQKCVTILNPKAGDQYTVTMKSVAGACPTKTTITLKGSDFTVQDVTTCPGGDVKIIAKPTTGSGADYQWKWEPQQFLDRYDIAEPTYTPGTDITYTVTMVDKDIKNCNQVKVVKVKVGSGFTVTALGETICEGDEATLSASGAEEYTWEPGGFTGSTVKVKPTTTTTYTVTGTNKNSSCPGNGTTTALVTVNQKPVITVSDQTICIGETAKLTGSITGGVTTGSWKGGNGEFSPGRTTIEATYKPTQDEIDAGSVTLTLESDDPEAPCVKDSKTMTISIVPPVTADAGPDQTICEGESAVLDGIYGGAATGGVWTGGKGTFNPSSSDPKATYTPSAAEISAGKVELKFSVTNGTNSTCPGGMDDMVISIDKKPKALPKSTKPVCAGEPIALSGSVENSVGGTWSGGTGEFKKDNRDLNGTYTPTPAEIAAGQVTLILTTDANGKCPPHKDSATFLINPIPVVNFGVDVPKACPPHCLTLSDSTKAGGSTNIVKWEWDFGIGTSSSPNPQDCFPSPGFYDVSLTVTSDAGCKASLKKEKYLETYYPPKAAFMATPKEVSQYDPTVKFTDQSSTDVTSWTWNLGDGTIISPKIQHPVHQYEKGVTGTYKINLVVVNDKGCIDSTYRFIDVLPEFTFFIPNAFTPNRKDGTNDTFFGKGVGIVEYQLWIFDRWGNMIFTAKDIDEGWDGRANGGKEIAQQDVYVWKVKLKDIFGKYHNYIGTVTLVR